MLGSTLVASSAALREAGLLIGLVESMGMPSHLKQAALQPCNVEPC